MRWITAAILLATLVLEGCAGAVVGGAAAGAMAVHDRRTFGTVIDDQTIEFKALNAIHNDKALREQAHVGVTSFNGVVLLAGETPTEALKRHAAELVRGIPNVRRVHNELAIAAPSSMSARASDTVLTARVKTRLFKVTGHEGFDPTRVKVVTKRGTVYLMGLVTQDEAEAVTDVVRQTDGVQKVVRLFEYVQPSGQAVHGKRLRASLYIPARP